MNTIEQARNLEHIRNLRQVISGKRSLARSIFDSLLPGQKQLLLKASGIENKKLMTFDKSIECRIQPNFDSLTDAELDNLTKGINRLKSIVDAFAHCQSQDFVKEERKVA